MKNVLMWTFFGPLIVVFVLTNGVFLSPLWLLVAAIASLIDHRSWVGFLCLWRDLVLCKWVL